MKLVQKDIDLRERIILNDLNEENLNSFIDEVKDCILKINFFVDNIDKFSNYEKYHMIDKFCNIVFEPKDYLRILSKEYKEHYVDYIKIKTFMLDKNGNNIEYFGSVTSEYKYLNNHRLNLKEIRNLIRSNKFLILKVNYINEIVKQKCEKYEKHPCLELDINNEYIDENNVLFQYALELFKKEVSTKDILFKLRNYYYKLMRQVKDIIDLKKHKKEELVIIGKKYENAFNKAIENNSIPKIRRIIVNHKKNSIK